MNTKNEQKVINMNAGKSLKMLMVQHEIDNETLVNDLGISRISVSSLRNSKLISGKNLSMLSKYFKISASEFLRLGEE